MNETKPSMIDVRFDDFLVDPEEVGAIISELGELAPTRARKRHVDRGGVETAVWIVLSYVGLKYLDTMFSAVASKHLDWLTGKLTKVFPSKVPELDFQKAVTVILSTDDLDIELNLPATIESKFFPEILQLVTEHFQKPPLSNEHIEHIQIPMVQYEEGWTGTFFPKASEFESRYWGIELNGFEEIDAIYDSEEGILQRIEPDSVL